MELVPANFAAGPCACRLGHSECFHEHHVRTWKPSAPSRPHARSFPSLARQRAYPGRSTGACPLPVRIQVGWACLILK